MNTLPDLIAHAGETEEDLQFLTNAWAEFLARGDLLHVAPCYDHHRDGRPWRCGSQFHRPTFGATRREAVELMIVKVVALRLKGKKSDVSVRDRMKETFSG